jgi:hypothetical protein
LFKFIIPSPQGQLAKTMDADGKRDRGFHAVHPLLFVKKTTSLREYKPTHLVAIGASHSMELQFSIVSLPIHTTLALDSIVSHRKY